MNPSRIVIRGGTVVTLGEPGQVLTGHVVVIEGERIAAIMPEAQWNERKGKIASKTSDSGQIDGPKGDETLINAKGKVVLPGFINAHMHFYSTFATGLTKAESAHSFVDILHNLWWRLDRKLTLEDTYYSALVACISAIRHGTTTILDHHASPNAVGGALGEIAKAVGEAGLRASLCYEISDRDGPKVAEAGLEENQAFLQSLKEKDAHKLHGLVGLHAAFTLGDTTLGKARELAEKYGTGVHIHVAEAQADQDHSIEKHQMRVVERLHRFGLVGPKSIFAHCVHVDASELELLAKHQAIVTHQPQSNMNNGVGVMDLLTMAQKGINVGLGTDAMTLNMREELRAAVWVHKLTQRDPSVAFGEAVDALLKGNSGIASGLFEVPVGTLQAGAVADVAIIDYDPPTPLTPDNVGGHMVFGLSQAMVDTTIASGRVLMQNKAIVGLDVAAIMAESRRLSQHLWDRF